MAIAARAAGATRRRAFEHGHDQPATPDVCGGPCASVPKLTAADELIELTGSCDRHRQENEMFAPKAISPLVAIFALVFFLTGLPGIASASDPFGEWRRPSTGTRVNFYACGGKLCAKIVGVNDQSRKGEIGTVIMGGAVKSGDNQWKGDLLDTDNGKTYAGVVTLEGPTALNLKGCVGFICQGETWVKVR